MPKRKHDMEQSVRQLFLDGYTISEVVQILGCEHQLARKVSRELGLANCGTTSWLRAYRLNPERAVQALKLAQQKRYLEANALLPAKIQLNQRAWRRAVRLYQHYIPTPQSNRLEKNSS